jgi:hypothetical protein
VDREHLIGRLPDSLAVALRMHDAGQDDAVIAVALGVPVQSVPQLLAVAEAKLANLPPQPHIAAPSATAGGG